MTEEEQELNEYLKTFRPRFGDECDIKICSLLKNKEANAAILLSYFKDRKIC